MSLPITSALRFWPWGPLGMGVISHNGREPNSAAVHRVEGCFTHIRGRGRGYGGFLGRESDVRLHVRALQLPLTVKL